MPYQQSKSISPSLDDLPSLIYADNEGRICDHPNLTMSGMSGNDLLLPDRDELVPLPFGSTLFYMPGRTPVGWDQKKNAFVPMSRKNSFAVAAFLPPGYVRTLLPATSISRLPPTLPLWAYTAAGWKGGRFWATGIMVDPNPHWDPIHFQDDEGLASIVGEALKRNKKNRLLNHLARCALEYHCFAAKNCFYRRWELPLPTSPQCNARCLGCLSMQPAQSCPAPHGRITFVPTVEEICEITLPHLEGAEDPIASFGQGCEGEPILQVFTIQKTIEKLRENTAKGIINLNTNGSKPDAIATVCSSGLDSLRVTINSPDPGFFNAYHKPLGFSLKEIKESLQKSRETGTSTAINLLVFPGITDREAERDRVIKFIQETGIDQIQMRNLNIDPDLYIRALRPSGTRYPLRRWMSDLRGIFPSLNFGYFNRNERKPPFTTL